MTMTDTSALSLHDWMDSQLHLSAAKMAAHVSAVSLVKHRRAFGQTVRPAKGSVIAAAGSSKSDSEPDYFFHWLRDSAHVMNAGLILIRNGIEADAWRERFSDFVSFSLKTAEIDGPRFLKETNFRGRTAETARQYLRPDEEIAAVTGNAVLGEVRYNADSTLDFLRWGRPQHDGPAARALVCLRYLQHGEVCEDRLKDVEALLRLDLDYTRTHSGEPCFDIWEEDIGWHFYTLLMQSDALRLGTYWAYRQNDSSIGWSYLDGRIKADDRLERLGPGQTRFYRSRTLPEGQSTSKELDFSVILAMLHRGHDYGRRSVWDTLAATTLQKLEKLFAQDYAINKSSRTPHGLAFGRYRGDSYVSGGAWFLCTFGAAEFYYKHAKARFSDPKDAELKRKLIAKGDAILEMARAFIPASGDISEQFDQTTGEQTSAKNLGWSHAAFITVWQARKDAMAIG